MALTQAGSALDAWALIAQNAVREGAVVDLSDSHQSILHIDVALGNTTAHTGTRIIVQTASAAADDEFWTERHDFVALVGTANTEVVLDDPLAALAVQIHVADLTGFTVATGGTLLAFLLDNTVADSELIRITSTSVEGANDHINILDGVKRAHAVTTSVLSNIASTFAVELPLGTLRARVIIDNLYDADGATVYSRTRVTKVTAMV
jgi:hypothetical protein